MQRLLHRWFVEYNPLYLLSAALVLAGLALVSGEASREGALTVAAIAEVYAFALIGAAALLVRRDKRRPAVMLALLAVCYQADLTLHVETCAFLGATGVVASVVWVALFVVKLYALAWALQLRPSCSAMFAPVLGAVGLAALPHAFYEVDAVARTQLVAIWAFAIGALVLWTCRSVDSRVGYDARGRRALAAVWWILGAIGLGHYAYWVAHFDVSAAALFAPAALLVTRWSRHEGAVFSWVTGTLVVIGVAVPESLALTALMGGVTLCLRALRQPTRLDPAAPPTLPNDPYRVSAAARAQLVTTIAFGLAPPAARMRLLLGAAACTHVAFWTAGWTGGAWPEHVALLDVALLAICLVAYLRTRRLAASLPASLLLLHLAIDLGLVSTPRTPLGWGLTLLSAGFVALLVALAISLRTPSEIRCGDEATHDRRERPRGHRARAAPVAPAPPPA